MAVDKRITYRRNFKGGADASMADFGPSTTSGRTGPGPNVSAGGASFNDLGPGPSGDDFRSSRKQFVDNLNRNNASRFKPSFFRKTYKPETLNTIGSRNQLRNKGGLRNLFKGLFGFATGIPIGLFNKGKSGITNVGNALGDFREKFTGYRTQQEYDDARQQRINLNRINTIQNTLDRNYSDGNYSNTDLDERLASLQQGLGIVPNTAAQNEQQFLDFGNELAENTKQTIFPAPTIEPNAQGYLYPTEGIAGVQFPDQTNYLNSRPSRDNPFEQVFPQRQLYPDAMVKLTPPENREYMILKTGEELDMNNPDQKQRLQQLEEKKNEAMFNNPSFSMFS